MLLDEIIRRGQTRCQQYLASRVRHYLQQSFGIRLRLPGRRDEYDWQAAILRGLDAKYQEHQASLQVVLDADRIPPTQVAEKVSQALNTLAISLAHTFSEHPGWHLVSPPELFMDQTAWQLTLLGSFHFLTPSRELTKTDLDALAMPVPDDFAQRVA